ncbi:MAG: STAS domain-containing protein [Acidobacteria bacterium]|nr:STAS domain-containing protein [Acidobacteriota bacterium]
MTSSIPLPKSVLALRQYDLHTFRHDLVAGVTVGLVALPLALAFAIASGLPPQSGIYCAIVTGFLISALGGSRVQIGGPTGAFVVVVAGIVATYGPIGLFMCTMMAGVMLIIAGLTGVGSFIKFIPRPVIIGFTNGIAVLIASTQIKDFLGLTTEANPGEFLQRMREIGTHLGTLHPTTTAVGVVTLVTALAVNRWVKAIPGTVAALVLGTGLAFAFGLHVETVGTRFGGVPSGLPSLHVPRFELSLVLTLLSPALTVATLGAIESLMSAVVADRMSGDRHNPNVELFAQGVANVMSPLFGGLPATGAIARTATNIRSGARTPVAGMIHALTLLAVLLVLAPVAARIPMAVLAGLLFVVAWNMGEWHEIRPLLRQTKADIAVWAVTFGLTVLADLTVAVEVGMFLAAALFVRRVSVTTTVSRVTPDYVREGVVHILQDKPIPDYVTVFRIQGPLLFGTADKVRRVTDRTAELPPVVIFRLRNMTAVDATGLKALEDAARELRTSGRVAIFCGARPQPAAVLRQAGFHEHVGTENVCPHIAAALERARVVHESMRTSSPSA